MMKCPNQCLLTLKYWFYSTNEFFPFSAKTNQLILRILFHLDLIFIEKKKF